MDLINLFSIKHTYRKSVLAMPSAMQRPTCMLKFTIAADGLKTLGCSPTNYGRYLQNPLGMQVLPGQQLLHPPDMTSTALQACAQTAC
jgi:hypothetical protein